MLRGCHSCRHAACCRKRLSARGRRCGGLGDGMDVEELLTPNNSNGEATHARDKERVEYRRSRKPGPVLHNLSYVTTLPRTNN